MCQHIHRAKKIVFVLRDFDPHNNFEKIVEMINADMAKIWRDIAKPESYANSQPSDFFHFQFFKFPSMVYVPKEFGKCASEMRMLFGDVPNGIFSGMEIQHLPADSFALLVADLWKKIRDEKELNLVIFRLNHNMWG